MGNAAGFALGNAITAGLDQWNAAKDRKFRQAQLENEMELSRQRLQLDRDRSNLPMQLEDQRYQHALDEQSAQRAGTLSNWMAQEKQKRDQRNQLLTDFQNDPEAASMSPEAKQRFALKIKYGDDVWPSEKPIEVPAGASLYDPTTKKPLFSVAPKPSPEDDTQRYMKTLQAKQLGQPVSPEDAAFATAYEKNKTIVPTATFNMNQPGKNDAREAGRLDKSYTAANTQLQSLRKPIADQADRIARLNDALDQATPQSDALVAPELLTALAGGQGSGLRMNEAELERVVGGRSKWQSLQATLNQWRTDPTKANSITPEQRQQMRALVSAVKGRADAKFKAIEAASQGLIDAGSVDEHRRIMSDLTSQLNAATNQGAGGGGGTVRMVAPNGQVKDVPADQVEHYRQMGAKPVSTPQQDD
jgi:hypothetical protein